VPRSTEIAAHNINDTLLLQLKICALGVSCITRPCDACCSSTSVQATHFYRWCACPAPARCKPAVSERSNLRIGHIEPAAKLPSPQKPEPGGGSTILVNSDRIQQSSGQLKLKTTKTAPSVFDCTYYTGFLLTFEFDRPKHVKFGLLTHPKLFR
jgi:hypothetical protein